MNNTVLERGDKKYSHILCSYICTIGNRHVRRNDKSPQALPVKEFRQAYESGGGIEKSRPVKRNFATGFVGLDKEEKAYEMRFDPGEGRKEKFL